MGYLAPGLFSVIPQLDTNNPNSSLADTAANKAQLLGYHRRPGPMKVTDPEDPLRNMGPIDHTGWRLYPAAAE